MVSEKNAALFFLLYFQYIFGQPPRCFTEHSALAIPSLLETDPQILERWGCVDEVHLDKSIRAKDFGLECKHDVTRF